MITCTSPVWLWGSLLTVVLAWMLPRPWQPAGIAACTAGFLLMVSPGSFAILTASATSVYALTSRRQISSAATAAGISLCTVIFLFYKWRQITSPHDSILIPLGISYYTFRQIHYIFEIYKGTVRERSLPAYLSYLFFLPTLLVGPIHRYDQFRRDLKRRRWDSGLFSIGLERVLFGYFKVIVLADYLVVLKLSPGVDAHVHWPLLRVYLNAVFSWLNLYFQFSGYSDIAIGTAALCGFEIMENFRLPFLAVNIREFWQRWHISLTNWCRDYIFYPLLAWTRRPFVSVVAAMLVIGLWHEISPRYVLWGVYHGTGIAVWHNFNKFSRRWTAFEKYTGGAAWRTASALVTLNFVILSYPVTRWAQSSMTQWMNWLI